MWMHLQSGKRAFGIFVSQDNPVSSSERSRATLRIFLCVLGFIASLLLVSAGCSNKGVSASASAPPPNVQVTQVIQKDVPVYHEWVATLDGQVRRLTDVLDGVGDGRDVGEPHRRAFAVGDDQALVGARFAELVGRRERVGAASVLDLALRPVCVRARERA